MQLYLLHATVFNVACELYARRHACFEPGPAENNKRKKHAATCPSEAAGTSCKVNAKTCTSKNENTAGKHVQRKYMKEALHC